MQHDAHARGAARRCDAAPWRRLAHCGGLHPAAAPLAADPPGLAARRLAAGGALALLLCLLGACASAPGPAPPPDAVTGTAVPRGTTFDAFVSAYEDGDRALAAELLPPLLLTGTERLRRTERLRLHAIALELATLDGDTAAMRHHGGQLSLAAADAEHAAARLPPAFDARAAAAAHLAASIDGFAAGVDRSARELPWSQRAQAALVAALWRYLSRLPAQALAELSGAAAAPAAAWWALAEAANGALTGSGRRQAYARWRSEHPGHVAARFPPPSLASPGADPVRIALLVPLGADGNLGHAARAVRDGLLAAYFHSLRERTTDAQTVRIYDTGAMSAVDAYRQASVDGADVIVGPLAKTAVAELARARPALPVVALNALDSWSDSSLVQLSVAVEDDAAAIARALAEDGVQRIVLFDMAGARPWSSRARDRLLADLDGVQVVGAGTLFGVASATGVVAEALRVTDSVARHQALSELLGARPEFTPRRRDDVDAVVALVDGAEMAALKPALAYHFASDLPVYAPPQAVRDVGLAGVGRTFVCGLPWRIQASALRSAAAAYATNRSGSAALFALGIDGFRVANQLERMTEHGESIDGSTGLLTLAADGRVAREPAWAVVADGRLVAVSQRRLEHE